MSEKLPQDIQHNVSLLFCFLSLPAVSNDRIDDHIKARMKQLHQLINACRSLPLVQQLQSLGVDWLPDAGYSPTGIPATTKDFLSQLSNIVFDTESMELMWCGDRITSTSTTHTSRTSILVDRSTKGMVFSDYTDMNSLSH